MPLVAATTSLLSNCLLFQFSGCRIIFICSCLEIGIIACIVARFVTRTISLNLLHCYCTCCIEFVRFWLRDRGRIGGSAFLFLCRLVDFVVGLRFGLLHFLFWLFLLLWLLYLHHRLRLVYGFSVHFELLSFLSLIRHGHLPTLAILQLFTIFSNILVDKLLRVIHLGSIVHVCGVDAAQVRMLPLPVVTIKCRSKLDQTEYYR